MQGSARMAGEQSLVSRLLLLLSLVLNERLALLRAVRVEVQPHQVVSVVHDLLVRLQGVEVGDGHDVERDDERLDRLPDRAVHELLDLLELAADRPLRALLQLLLQRLDHDTLHLHVRLQEDLVDGHRLALVGRGDDQLVVRVEVQGHLLQLRHRVLQLLPRRLVLLLPLGGHLHTVLQLVVLVLDGLQLLLQRVALLLQVVAALAHLLQGFKALHARLLLLLLLQQILVLRRLVLHLLRLVDERLLAQPLVRLLLVDRQQVPLLVRLQHVGDVPLLLTALEGGAPLHELVEVHALHAARVGVAHDLGERALRRQTLGHLQVAHKLEVVHAEHTLARGAEQSLGNGHALLVHLRDGRELVQLAVVDAEEADVRLAHERVGEVLPVLLLLLHLPVLVDLLPVRVAEAALGGAQDVLQHRLLLARLLVAPQEVVQLVEVDAAERAVGGALEALRDGQAPLHLVRLAQPRVPLAQVEVQHALVRVRGHGVRQVALAALVDLGDLVDVRLPRGQARLVRLDHDVHVADRLLHLLLGAAPLREPREVRAVRARRPHTHGVPRGERRQVVERAALERSRVASLLVDDRVPLRERRRRLPLVDAARVVDAPHLVRARVADQPADRHVVPRLVADLRHVRVTLGDLRPGTKLAVGAAAEQHAVHVLQARHRRGRVRLEGAHHLQRVGGHHVDVALQVSGEHKGGVRLQRRQRRRRARLGDVRVRRRLGAGPLDDETVGGAGQHAVVVQRTEEANGARVRLLRLLCGRPLVVDNQVVVHAHAAVVQTHPHQVLRRVQALDEAGTLRRHGVRDLAGEAVAELDAAILLRRPHGGAALQDLDGAHALRVEVLHDAGHGALGGNGPGTPRGSAVRVHSVAVASADTLDVHRRHGYCLLVVSNEVQIL
eukprot:Rhum_TRINITY_DN10881_c0_g1::Rhum_TRINITY_DN10881_c0_g1_i1::g.40947::m.40947